MPKVIWKVADQNLQQIRQNLNSMSDMIHEKENIFDERKQYQDNLTHKIENSQVIQANLDEHVHNLDNQWVSKRILITNAVNTVNDLREKIYGIKDERTNTVYKKEKQEMKNSSKVEVNHEVSSLEVEFN